MTMTDPPGPQEIAAGLRRLADFVEHQGDSAPTVSAYVHLSYYNGIGARQLAALAEVGDEMLPPNQFGRTGVRLDGLAINLSGPDNLFGVTTEVAKIVTEVTPFDRETLIARGHDASLALADGPF